MLKLFTTIVLLFTSMIARENPFFPLKGENDIAYTTNVVIKAPPLKIL